MKSLVDIPNHMMHIPLLEETVRGLMCIFPELSMYLHIYKCKY